MAASGGSGAIAARARLAHKRRPASSAMLAAAVVIAVVMLSSTTVHAYDEVSITSPISYADLAAAESVSRSSAGRQLAAAAASGTLGNDTSPCGLFGCEECKAAKGSKDAGTLPTCAKCLSGFKKAKGGCGAFWRL
jgi:hypothetical protein